MIKKKVPHQFPTDSPPRTALETSEMDKYDKILLPDDRTAAQLQVVASGGLSKVAKAERGQPKSYNELNMTRDPIVIQ